MELKRKLCMMRLTTIPFLVYVFGTVSMLWEPYPSQHNGLFSPLLVRRDFAARQADHWRTVLRQLLGSISADRVICGTDLAECVSVPGDILWPQGTFLPGFYLLRGGSSPGAWGTLNKGNADGAVIFGNAGRVWATALRWDPPKKALCHTWPLGGAVIKYRR